MQAQERKQPAGLCASQIGAVDLGAELGAVDHGAELGAKICGAKIYGAELGNTSAPERTVMSPRGGVNRRTYKFSLKCSGLNSLSAKPGTSGFQILNFRIWARQ